MTEEWLQQKHDRMGLDCFIAAAVITGVGGLVSAGVGAGASLSAANTQANAANNAANLQEQQFNTTQQEQAPYRQAGATALGTLTSDMANGTGFASPFNFQADPGYGFQLQQGQQAINNSASAQSGVLNGGTLKALDQYTTGLANTTYGDAYNRYLAGSQQGYNQLLGVSQLGENATQATGNAGAAAANNAGNYLTQAGNATASGAVGAGNAINSGIGSIANGVGTYGILQGLQSASSYGNKPLVGNPDEIGTGG
jgi:hypothetical protein